eukprot:8185582-Lingulodinium_polyedra.AAC.1
MRSCSPVAWASSTYENPFKNALSMSNDAKIQSLWHAASLASTRCDVRLAVPEKASTEKAS